MASPISRLPRVAIRGRTTRPRRVIREVEAGATWTDLTVYYGLSPLMATVRVSCRIAPFWNRVTALVEAASIIK